MNKQSEQLKALKDIKQMMERSSRFISLSGWSGVAAGSCALIGAWLAYGVIAHGNQVGIPALQALFPGASFLQSFMGSSLFTIAVLTFFAALSLGFLFTYLRSRKKNIPMWGVAAQRLMINVCVPIFVGGIYLFKLIEIGAFGFIAPGCLIFYGIALLNASKYTLPDIRYLGYAEIALGIINLWFVGFGLYFWAVGFGILHIVYGLVMWYKYERISEL